MTTFDNRDVISLAGKILERLGDKSSNLPKESLEKISNGNHLFVAQ